MWMKVPKFSHIWCLFVAIHMKSGQIVKLCQFGNGHTYTIWFKSSKVLIWFKSSKVLKSKKWIYICNEKWAEVVKMNKSSED